MRHMYAHKTVSTEKSAIAECVFVRDFEKNALSIAIQTKTPISRGIASFQNQPF